MAATTSPRWGRSPASRPRPASVSPPPATSTGPLPARSSPTSAWFLLAPVELAVPTWLTVLRWLTAAALAGGCWGAFTSLYRTAAVARFLRGRGCAPGTLEGWRSLGRRHGEADLLFEDGRGVRHRVPVVVARRALARETVLAVYDPARPGDVARTRAALPRKEAKP
ncbi:hypothetical protein [Streptomyces koyangensis]